MAFWRHTFRKTFTCDILVGGRDCKDCHFQQGPFDWVTNYTGQEILYLNEYRASGKRSFHTITIDHGRISSRYQEKGTFIPVRINKFSSPVHVHQKLMCELFGQVVSFRGEYESQNRYSTDHESTAWEDVDQVVERIRESGGKLVAHARKTKRKRDRLRIHVNRDLRKRDRARTPVKRRNVKIAFRVK